jgi:ribosomal protein S18 acetylase RimI-like enzyme
MLTPDDPLIWINYAVPIAQPTKEDLEEMIAVFRSANRTPRLEFFLDLWPNAAKALEQNGFVCEKRMPIMVLNKDDWKGLEHRHDIQPVQSHNFHEFNRVLGEAFGMPEKDGSEQDPDPKEDPTFQRIKTGETLAVAALHDGKIVGGGLGVGTNEIREIAGIATKSAHRKQGIASAVIATLLDQFFQNGGEIAWLTPGDDSAKSVYEKLGFKTIAEQVVYELPTAPE